MIVFMAVRLVASLHSTGLVADEFAHIPAGYLYLTEHRFDFNPEHPPLIKSLAALPLLFLGSMPTHIRHAEDWSDWFAYCSEFFYLSGEQARRVITWARVPMVLISCLLAFVIYRWASALFGSAGGLFSLFLFIFEPNILAHSRLVLTDIGSSFAYCLFWYLVWRWLKNPSFGNSIMTSLTAAASLLVKHSMVVVPVCWFLILISMVFLRKLTVRQWLQTIALSFLLMVLVLNIGYGFRSRAFNSGDLKMVAGWLGWHSENSWIGELLDRFSLLPIPPDYLRGLDVVVNHDRSGHPAYLLGQYSEKGWWYYFPVALLLKVPLPLLLLFAFSLAWLAVRLGPRDRTAMFCILFPMTGYFGMSMLSHINIGIRHILPVFPFMLVAAGGLFASAWHNQIRFRWALLALGTWLAGVSLTISYDPIEYFNELAGGPENGWHYLTDSNTDYGQDFPKVVNYIKANGISNSNLYLVGTEYNLLTGIHFNCFLPYRLPDKSRSYLPYTYHETSVCFRPGVYIVSTAKLIDPFVFLTGVNESDRVRAGILRRLLTLKPKVKIGNAILVFDLSQEDIDQASLSQLLLYYYDDMTYVPEYRALK